MFFVQNVCIFRIYIFSLLVQAPNAEESEEPLRFVFQTDCPPDGTGTNADFWRLPLLLAMRLRAQNVWNAANFISENTPQYMSGETVLWPLSTAPADVLGAFGFERSWPSSSFGGDELYEKIGAGKIAAWVVNDIIDVNEPYVTQLQLDTLVKRMEVQFRSFEAQALAAHAGGETDLEGTPTSKQRPTAMILQQCAPVYVARVTYEWPLLPEWMRTA